MNIDKDIELLKEIPLVPSEYIDEDGEDVLDMFITFPITQNQLVKAIRNVLSDRETWKKIAERYEMECKSFRAFCRKIRKTEKRNVDEFNQGREYAYIQFLNLINGEQNWEHEGKYFDEVDQELENWARKEVDKYVKD